jgi:hypothetical protein
MPLLIKNFDKVTYQLWVSIIPIRICICSRTECMVCHTCARYCGHGCVGHPCAVLKGGQLRELHWWHQEHWRVSPFGQLLAVHMLQVGQLSAARLLSASHMRQVNLIEHCGHSNIGEPSQTAKFIPSGVWNQPSQKSHGIQKGQQPCESAQVAALGVRTGSRPVVQRG